MTEPSALALASPVPPDVVPRSLATLQDPDSAAWAVSFAAHHAALPSGRNGVPGVDYAWTKPSISALKGAGEVFVAQYFSQDPAKNLTPARAHDLLAAGIRIVVVWEYTANAARGGKVQGQRDAENGEAQAKVCHIDGIPLYWAVDYDAPPGDQDEINAYSDGWASVVGDDRGRNAYGGYWPLSRLKAAGKAKRLWGTPAWSGSNWATSGLRPDIMQGAMINVGGVQCDLDAGLSADYGQWPRPKVPASGPVPTWQAWQTKGHTSLAQVGEAVSMQPSSILRRTAIKYGAFDDVIAAYVNGLAAGTVKPSDPIPAGGKLWVRR